MKVTKEEVGSHTITWFKAFEKRLIANLSRIQDFLSTWRNFLLSAEFWDMSWFWTAFWMNLCSLRIRFSIGQGARKSLMSWVSSQVPKQYVEGNFPTCFKDGILLCALAEKLVPGACPRFDLLDGDQRSRNLKLALHLIEKHIKIKSPIKADEILQDEKFPEKKLLLLIAQMKMASEKFELQGSSLEPRKDFMSRTTFVSDKCFARGMGLLLAVRGRKACFTILLDSIEHLDMVIEIRGPENTACSKRITSAYSISRNESEEFQDLKDSQIQDAIFKQRIPLEYTILGRKISVCYTPLVSGVHYMSIIWQGQHITGSPYTITVDTSVDAPDIWQKSSKHTYRRLKRSDGQDLGDSVETTEMNLSPEPRGVIKRKTILRYIVRMEGKDVVIDGKEDLCEAINRIKQQMRKASSSSSEESVELNAEWPFKKGNQDFKKDIKTDNDIWCGFSAFPSINSKLNQDEFFKMDSPGLVKENNPEKLDFATEEWNMNHFDSCSTFGLLDKFAPDWPFKNESREVTQRFKNKNSQNIFKLENTCFSNDRIVHASDSTNESENLNVKHDEIKVNHTENVYNKNNLNEEATNRHKTKMKSEGTFLDKNGLELESEDKSNKLPNNDVHSNISSDTTPPSNSDDLCFFPVHKVQYAMINDDEEDTDDHTDYSSKRRASFAELHESNYLDESKGSGEEEFSSLVEHKSIEETDIYHNAITNYGSGDIRDCLRANHDLFQCDHSLSFWSQTVTDTSPDYEAYESNSLEIIPESNNSNASESTFSSKNPFSGMYLDLHTSVGGEKSKLGTNPFENNFCDLSDADFLDLISSFPQSSDADEQEANYIELMRRSLREQSESRKHWPERKALPAIQESSFESVMDFETQNDKKKNKEAKESNLSFNLSKTDRERDDTCTPVFSPAKHTVTKFGDKSSPRRESSNQTNTLLTPPEQKEKISIDRSENMIANKLDKTNEESHKSTLLPSTNNLSASTNNSKTQLKKCSEIRFSTCTYLERNQAQRSPTSEFSPHALSNSPSRSQDPLSSYILTYASPAIMGSSQNLNSRFSKGDYSDDNLDPDTYDQDSPQCLSVKKAVQIFQKEQDELVDTGSTETQNSKCSNKIAKDDILKNKTPDGSSDLSDSENCPFSPGQKIPRSSIKDRVKLFESAKVQP